jgi:hypothetical protein
MSAYPPTAVQERKFRGRRFGPRIGHRRLWHWQTKAPGDAGALFTSNGPFRPHHVSARADTEACRERAGIAFCHLGYTQIFDIGKPLAAKDGGKFSRIEEGEPGLAARRSPLGGCHQTGAALGRMVLKRLGVLETPLRMPECWR